MEGKRQLLEAEGADVLNIHGHISDSMQAGRLAAKHGVPISLGNTTFEVGVHLAAALPEVIWMEYSFQNVAHLLESPVEIKNGYAYAPERPGHGLKLSDEARTRYAQPKPRSMDDLLAEAPPHPIINLTPE